MSSTVATPSAIARTRAAGASRFHTRGRLLPYAMVAPTLAVIAGVMGVPLAVLLLISFQHYGLRELIAHQGVWVGLGNYRLIASDPFFWHVVEVSILFTAACVLLSMALGTLLALLLERLSRVVRVLLIAGLVFVWATPVVVAVDLWQWMFDYEFGVMNWLLTHLRVGNFIHHNWFYEPLQGFAVIVVVVVWGALPFIAVTLYAGLAQVPKELIEAAQVDGARPRQVFLGVVVPILQPLFLVLTSLSTIWDFQVLVQDWVLLNQRPSRDYFLVSVYSYDEAFSVSHYGLGSAIAVVMVAIMAVLTIVYVRQMMRVADEAPR